MLTNDQKLSALYNSEGEQITDYQYQSFEKVGNRGYIITNAKKQVGFIDLDGDEKKMIKKKNQLKIHLLRKIFMF